MELKKLRNTLISKKVLLQPREKLPDLYQIMNSLPHGILCQREKIHYRRSSQDEIKQQLPFIPDKYILKSTKQLKQNQQFLKQPMGSMSTIRNARKETQESLIQEKKNKFQNMKNRSMITLNNEIIEQNMKIQRIDELHPHNKFAKLMIQPINFDNIHDISFNGWNSKSSQRLSN